MARSTRAIVRIWRFLKKDQGVTAVEFALVALPFFLILLGTFEVGRALHFRATLDDLADRTIRQIYISEFDPTTDEASLEAQMTHYARSIMTRGDPSLLNVDVSPGAGARSRTMTLNYNFRFTVNVTGDADLMLHTTRAFAGS
ncbi:pilus assembly protein [Lutimaribacter sp. EGI FJ00015]|uniref:Pilus assembly protein n=1 Tax=Lutimaribacter degradans TaxID=2945989 RepID=A0ACC5ZYT8_9RHOB|nr:TadE/TadG family type IV pilus assembly protein [Lutimaribacter sp. EGI FJ00013]MCM2563353.1 pilus assembly protein [Lutimaribacter sp. EGI FJ00013]MCO0614569.1 pilus assembly protein [Lutimaribacter sp. EGI FJ00015]MCO0637241.1 pilus assembly protein [Lutimaribacter sp. EGI FJ00014]